MLFYFFKNPTGEQYDLGGECPLPKRIMAQVLRPMPLPKSHKTESILQPGGTLIAKKEGKLAVDCKKLLIVPMHLFSSCLFLCPSKATLYVQFPRRSVCFLLSACHQLFHSLQNASLPSPCCSALPREVWRCLLSHHPAFVTAPAQVRCGASNAALQW